MARRAKLVLDKGAYCGEGGFLGQMAAMHACGPYLIDHVFVEAHLNYTNNQPSGSVRAPTAPQVCWGLEQHMDEVAAAIGMDPVELRRRTLIEEGAEGPTRQVFEKVGVRDTLEKAVEMIGYGRELPDDEAIGVAVGWWPCMPAPSGAYVQMNGDGSATIVTGAQENGSGAVMAMPMFVGQELGIDPNDVSILYQDTDVAPWDMGSCGSQTTFNSGRAILAAAKEVREQLLDAAADQLEVDREDLELAEGVARVKGSPDRSVAIADLVGEIGTVHGKGSGEVPEAPTGDTGGCVGRLGNETFLAPQLITQAAHVKVDRATGVVRVLKVAAAHDSGRILNRAGADGQVLGGVVMGVGLALSEGTMLDEQGRQRNPHLLDYKLLTCSDAPEIEVEWIEYDSVGPRGSKGVGEPPQVPTAGAIANAISKVIGRPVPQLPMTPERVWAAATESRDDAVVHARRPRVDDALSAMAGGARPVAGGTDLVVGARQGKAPLPDAIVAIDRIDGLRAIEVSDGGLRLGTLVTHGDLVANEDIRTPLHGDRRRLRDRGLPRHARAGHDRRQRDERLARDGHRGAAAVLRRDGDAPVARRASGPSRSTSSGPARARPRRGPDELLVALELPAPAAGTGSSYVRLEYRRQMEIAVVGAAAVVTVDGDRITDARVAITALTPTIRRVPEAESALTGTDGGAEAVAASAAAAAAASTPISDVRGSADYRRAMAEVIASRAIRRGAHACARRDRPDPREPGAARRELRSER